MRSFWSDPYLWLHLAGLATVPLWLEICLLGLAVGDPVLPVWMEVLLVGIAGIAPILWMQWQKPFCIYSLLFFAVSPTHMSEGQRRLLRLFKTSVNQILAIPVAVGLLIVLWQLYLRAPLVASVAPFGGQRWYGLGMAAIAFFFANLFTQVPVSVLRVLLSSDAQVAAQVPYPAERIAQDFTLFGFRLRQLLPVPPARVAVPTAAPSGSPSFPLANPEATPQNKQETPPPPAAESVPPTSEELAPANSSATEAASESSSLEDVTIVSEGEPPPPVAADKMASTEEETTDFA